MTRYRSWFAPREIRGSRLSYIRDERREIKHVGADSLRPRPPLLVSAEQVLVVLDHRGQTTGAIGDDVIDIERFEHADRLLGHLAAVCTIPDIQRH